MQKLSWFSDCLNVYVKCEKNGGKWLQVDENPLKMIKSQPKRKKKVAKSEKIKIIFHIKIQNFPKFSGNFEH